MNLQRSYKSAIRFFIRTQWSDQKLADVLAFNLDGNMSYYNYSSCLLAVTLAPVLHTKLHFRDAPRYHEAKRLPGAIAAEHGYANVRNNVLRSIIRAEMRRRFRGGHFISEHGADRRYLAWRSAWNRAAFQTERFAAAYASLS